MEKKLFLFDSLFDLFGLFMSLKGLKNFFNSHKSNYYFSPKLF